MVSMHVRSWPKAATVAHLSGPCTSNLSLLSHFQSIIDFNAKVANRALELSMP